MADPAADERAAADELAKRRWSVLQLMRLIGFAIAILGVLMIAGKVELAGKANALVGYGLLVIGMVDGFYMPVFLARKWRSPKQ